MLFVSSIPEDRVLIMLHIMQKKYDALNTLIDVLLHVSSMILVSSRLLCLKTHGIRNEKQANDQRNEHYALLTSRQEDEKGE
jgi:hypothetical protein